MESEENHGFFFFHNEICTEVVLLASTHKDSSVQTVKSLLITLYAAIIALNNRE